MVHRCRLRYADRHFSRRATGEGLSGHSCGRARLHRGLVHGRRRAHGAGRPPRTRKTRVDASSWVDFMHLARWNGRWVIINILWENAPR
jgi:hypothetical protein